MQFNHHNKNENTWPPPHFIENSSYYKIVKKCKPFDTLQNYIPA